MDTTMVGEKSPRGARDLSARKAGLHMQVKLTCPQCRAALKMEQAPVPGKAITCPNCKVKFAAVAVSGDAESAGSSRGMWALVALVLAASVGGIVWHKLSNRDDESVQIAANTPSPKADEKAGNPESSPGPSKSNEASPSKDANAKSVDPDSATTPPKQTDKSPTKAPPENEPYEPQPMPKKSATKK